MHVRREVKMNRQHSFRGIRFLVLTAAAAAALLVAAPPGLAERVTPVTDTSYEIHRITSLHAGGTTESIGPAETEPRSPVFGKMSLMGTTTRFVTDVAVAWWDGKVWRPTPATWTVDRVPGTGTEDGNPALFSIVVRFDAQQIQAVYNRWVLVQVYEGLGFVQGAQMPDRIELLFLRQGHP